MLGLLLKEVETVQTTDIDFSEFPNGVYFIQSRDNRHTLKVLKQ